MTPEYLQGVTTTWDLFLLLNISIVLFLVPFKIAFFQSVFTIEWSFECALTVFFIIDSYRCYKNSKSGFSGWGDKMLHLFSLLPLQLLSHMLGAPTPLSIGLSLFRVMRGYLLYMRIQDRSKNKFVQKKSKIGLVAIACFVVVHWIACFWALLNPKEGGDILEGYIEATYWTITTLTTVGYGDITPQNNIARFFTMFVMVTGVGFYGLVIGQFSRIMLDSDKRKAEENEKLEALTSLLTRYEIPANIQDQAFQFYQHVLSKQAGQEEIKVMKDLPKALQAELQIYMNIKLLNNVALFQNVSHVCLKAIAKNLKQVYFSPSEKIINNGEIGDEMFIIGHGKVSVHDGSHHIATLASGQCFGEMALMGDAIRKADVTSISYCDLFVLTKEIFSNLLDEFDDLRKNVEEIALSRKRENEHHSKTQKKNVG